MKLIITTTYFSIFFLITFLTSCKSSDKINSYEIKVGFYNVENLFDTLDTPNKNDEDFLPSGKYNWKSERYNEKISHINKVIGEIGSPSILGFCEVENAIVVRDIINHGALKSNYGLVHAESLDKRGIDNAMIYDSTLFQLEDKGIIRIDMPDTSYKTRDILWAKLSYKKDTILCMINHWPSRRGGQEASEPKRMLAAQAARKYIDSIQEVNSDIIILFMGDLNDYPNNNAPKLIAEKLSPMISEESGEFGGTHSYRNEWGVLDHIMISNNLFDNETIKVIDESGKITSAEWMKETYKGNIVPFRTYGGTKYLGGYSDHFPVTISLILKN